MKKKLDKTLFVFSFLILLVPLKVFSSACCGGGFAIPSLITDDEKAMVTTTYSYSKVDTDVTQDGVWIRRNNDNLNSKILKIDVATIIDDRFQTGVSIPLQTRTETSASTKDESTGLGDVVALAGYEYLPDWDYNPWRPHGVGFLSLTFPTGKSIQESETATGIDSRGRGFWSAGVGTTLTKNWLTWDANLTIEGHHSFQKAVHNSQIDGEISPGNGGTLSLGAGYSVKDLRLGTMLSWNYEDPIKVDGVNSSDGAVERFATGAVMASYVFENNWAGTVSYSDQTLFGDPTRTTLSKSFAVSVQKRWAR